MKQVRRYKCIRFIVSKVLIVNYSVANVVVNTELSAA